MDAVSVLAAVYVVPDRRPDSRCQLRVHSVLFQARCVVRRVARPAAVLIPDHEHCVDLFRAVVGHLDGPLCVSHGDILPKGVNDERRPVLVRRKEHDGFVPHCTDAVLVPAHSGVTCELLRSVRCGCCVHENDHGVACGVCGAHSQGHFRREEQLPDVRHRWWTCAGQRGGIVCRNHDVGRLGHHKTDERNDAGGIQWVLLDSWVLECRWNGESNLTAEISESIFKLSRQKWRCGVDASIYPL